MKRLAWLALAIALAPVARGANGGPDGLGYRWTDTADGCATDLPALTPAAQRVDDPTAAIPVTLAFPFPWAGRTVSQAWISPTGFVAFSDQGLDGASAVPQSAPDPAPPNDLVAPFWRYAPARFVQWEDQGARFVIEWAWDRSTFGYDTAWLEIMKTGSLRMSWGGDRFAPSDATVCDEDATGARGSTYFHDGAGVEPGFPRPMSGQAACFTPPSRLGCSSPIVVACGDSIGVDLPASAPSQAEVYPCSPNLYPANEAVLKLDVTTPQAVHVTTIDPNVDILRIAAPPPCSEATCLDYADETLTIPVAFVGEQWFVVDATVPGAASPRVDVTCDALPWLTCGNSYAGTTVGGTNAQSEYAGVSAALDGGEWHGLLVSLSTGTIEALVTGTPPGTWVILRDDTGHVVAAGEQGASAFDAPPGAYVVTVDEAAGTESPFQLSVSCGHRLDCAAAQPLACDAHVTGDTSLSGPSRVGRYPCSRYVLDGRESTFRFTVPGDRVVDVRLTSGQPLQQVIVLPACDEADCAFGADAGACAQLTAGDWIVVVDEPAGHEGPFELQATCRLLGADVVDLEAASVDASAIVSSCHDTSADGTLHVGVRNLGARDALAAFNVVAFVDADGDRQLGASDAVLGRTRWTAGIPGESAADIPVPMTGTLAFREAPITVMVDERDELSDVNRGNQVRSTADECIGRPDTLPLGLRQEWEWTSSSVAPLSVESESIPLVADMDGDGNPEIVFVTQECCTGITEGIVRVVSGRDGSELWSADDPARRVRVATALAIGDVDRDGRPEIVGQLASDTSRLILLNDDGSLRWTSSPLALQSAFDTYSGAPSLADLDGDGFAEVIWGPNALDGRTGAPFWTPEAGGTLGSNTGGPIVTVADLDADGHQEVIAGPTAYTLDASTSTGRILWTNASLPDGFTAALDADGDGMLEIALVAPYRLMLLDGSNGGLIWDVPLPQGGGATCGGTAGTAGGPPTIADLDGDGRPEILVVVADWLVAFHANGQLMWRAPWAECSSGTTSVTVFDLDGDGAPEVIGKDEQSLRILSGSDGVLLASVPGTSGTAREMPVIADVDGDGSAEIVVVDNRLLGGSGTGMYGLRVYGSDGAPWQGARTLWNEHAYHVSNVADDLTLPAPSDIVCLPPSPLAGPGFRVQRAVPRNGPGAPNLTATFDSAGRVAQAGCTQSIRIRIRCGNAGSVGAGPFSVAFFDGDTGSLITSVPVGGVAPGAYEIAEATVDVSATSPLNVRVAVDEPGVITECREEDNDCFVTDADAGTTPMAPPLDVGPALRVHDAGDPNAPDVTATLDWTRDVNGPRVLGMAPGEQHYHVTRALLGFGVPAFAPIPGTEPMLAVTYVESTPRALDSELPKAQGYLVVAADACERESQD